MDLEVKLQDEENGLMKELLSRALSQNPDLAIQLQKVRLSKESAKWERIEQVAKIGDDWQRKQDDERKKNRKIRYDDKRNINLLNAIKRDPYYKIATIEEQHQMLRDRYYTPMGLQAPFDSEVEEKKMDDLRRIA